MSKYLSKKYNQKESTKTSIIPLFIFTEDQINPKRNTYFSNQLVKFMCDSLLELKEIYKKTYGIKMYFLKGENTLSVLKNIQSKYNIESIGYNLDYSPYAKERHRKIQEWIKNKNKNEKENKKIKLFCEEDILLSKLFDGDTCSISSKKPYQKFSSCALRFLPLLH